MTFLTMAPLSFDHYMITVLIDEVSWMCTIENQTIGTSTLWTRHGMEEILIFVNEMIIIFLIFNGHVFTIDMYHEESFKDGKADSGRKGICFFLVLIFLSIQV